MTLPASQPTTHDALLVRPARLAAWINLAMVIANAVLIYFILTGQHNDARIVLAAAIMILGPGSAFVQWLLISEYTVQLATLMAMSISASIVTSQALVAFHVTSGAAMAFILGAMTLMRPPPGSRWTKPRYLQAVEPPRPERKKMRRSIFGRKSTVPSTTVRKESS